MCSCHIQLSCLRSQAFPAAMASLCRRDTREPGASVSNTAKRRPRGGNSARRRLNKLPAPACHYRGEPDPSAARRMHTDVLRGDGRLSSNVSGMFLPGVAKARIGETNPQLGMMAQWAPRVMGTPALHCYVPGWWSPRPSDAFATRENLSQQLQWDLEKTLPPLVLLCQLCFPTWERSRAPEHGILGNSC